MKRNALAAALASAALLLSACGGDGGESGSEGGDSPINVGVEVSSTGQVAFYGTEQQRGFELAQAAINEAGGINGRDLKFDIKDNASETEESVVNFKNFASDDKIVATIGPTSSRDALVALEITAQAGLPSVTLSLAPEVMDIGDNVFRPIVADDQMIPPFLQGQVEDHGLKTIAFLGANDDPNSLSVYNAYKAAAQSAGLEIVADETYLGTDTEWSAQIAKVKRANPDSLVLYVLAQEAGNLVTAVREAGISVPIFGAAALNSQAMVDQAGAAANDIFLPDFWSSDFDTPENKAFAEAYQAAHGTPPTRFAASAYGAAFFLAEALKGAEDPDDRASVLEAMGAVTDFPVIGSPLVMKDRQATTEAPVALVVRDGAFQTVN